MRTAGQGPGGFETRDGFMKPGQDIIMAGWTGHEGCVRIAGQNREMLKKRFTPMFLDTLDRNPWDEENTDTKDRTVRDWLTGVLAEKNSPVTAWEYAGEGGILAALWNLSGIYNAGIDVDLRLFPMKQITVELCELFELNPYRLLCGDCAVFVAWGGSTLVRQLKQAGIPAAVIGSVIPGIARKIRHGEESAGYLERPQPDELKKVIPWGTNR